MHPYFYKNCGSAHQRELECFMKAVCEWITPSHALGSKLTSSLILGEHCDTSRQDLSNFHTAVLWVGSTVVGFCLVRAFGHSLAEVPYVETRPEYRGNRLAQHLLGNLEQALLLMGVNKIVMPMLKSRQEDGVQVWRRLDI